MTLGQKINVEVGVQTLRRSLPQVDASFPIDASFRLCARPLCVPLTLRGRARTLPLTHSPFDQRLHASLPCL